MALLEIHDLAVGYGRGRRVHRLLEKVNCTADAGELVCLVGPNGAGKSTLLRTIGKLQRPLAGSVELVGSPVSELTSSQVARRLAVVLTDRIEPGRLTCAELVGLGRHPYSSWGGALDAEDRAIVDEALACVGASDLAGQQFTEISDGQRQRVVVARALAQTPQVLTLDEPTAFLDPPARLELMALLRDLSRRRGMAVVACTHDLDAAIRAADRIWVAYGGTVRTGSPTELIANGVLVEAFAGRAGSRALTWFAKDLQRMEETR